jgi:hypothetical protein
MKNVLGLQLLVVGKSAPSARGIDFDLDRGRALANDDFMRSFADDRGPTTDDCSYEDRIP